MNNVKDRFRVIFSIPQKDRIDDLAWHLMTRGYIIIQRKLGKYLSDPPHIAGYDVDLIAHKGKDYLLAVIINSEDDFSEEFTKKIEVLSNRRTRYTNRIVQLYLSVPTERLNELRRAMAGLSEELRKNIKIHVYSTTQIPSLFSENAPRQKSFIN